MASSTSNLDLISSSQASKEVTANALFDASSVSSLFGRRASTTTALTWGYYGGVVIIGNTPTSVANGTIALSASLVNYIEYNPGTGALVTNTSGWSASSLGYARVYGVTCGASTITSYVDWRFQGIGAPVAQFPMMYISTWNASTNTPTLAGGTGTKGYFYKVSTGGTQDLGNGSTVFTANDSVVYNGATWDIIQGGITPAEINAAYGFTLSGTASKTYTLPTVDATMVYSGGALGTPASGTLDNCISNTETAGNNSTQLATTAYADRLTNGSLPGTVTTLTVTTAITDNTATTQAASTAFTKAQIAADKNATGYAQAVKITDAASGSNGISILISPACELGTSNFTLSYDGSVPNWIPSANQNLLYTVASTKGASLRLDIAGTISLNLFRVGGNISMTSSVGTGIVNGTSAVVTVSVTRETASVDGSVVFYVNGVQLGTSRPIAYTTAGAGETLSNAATWYILGTNVIRYAGTVKSAKLFNRALSADDVLDLYRNGVNFADKSGSQTSIITGNDSTFAGASNWANVDINSYDETTGGVLTITANAASQYCTLPVANATTVTNKNYQLKFDVTTLTSTWTIKEFGGTTTIGTVSSTGTAKIEFTASTTGGLRLVSDATNSAAVLDNFLLYEIGATFALEPEGIKLGKWYDSSSNNLNASYPNAGFSFTRQVSTLENKQPVPTAGTGSATLTIAQLLTGIITDTHATGATATYTLPIATLMDAALPSFNVGDSFDWSLINLSAAAADTATVAAGTSHTVVGSMVVQSANAATGALYGSTGRFKTRKTAASTYETYRTA